MRRNSPSRRAMQPSLARPLVPGLRACAALALCVACAGGSAATPALLDGAGAAAWPRVFYSPAQRAAIEHARAHPPGDASAAAAGGAAAQPAAAAAEDAPQPATLLLQGTARGRHGATAWINGQMLQQGERYAGRNVLILPDGRVRMARDGAPDLVLRPGQQISADGAERQDVLPADALVLPPAAPPRGLRQKVPQAGG